MLIFPKLFFAGILILELSNCKTLQSFNFLNKLKRVIAISAISLSPTILFPYNSWSDITWTERNTLAAETWKAVDEAFYERTFNGNDWFSLRQSVVKRNYASDEEVYNSLKDMLGKLGDKYTRFLTPVQYSSLLNSAKGELTGVGVELLPLVLDDNIFKIIFFI